MPHGKRVDLCARHIRRGFHFTSTCAMMVVYVYTSHSDASGWPLGRPRSQSKISEARGGMPACVGSMQSDVSPCFGHCG